MPPPLPPAAPYRCPIDSRRHCRYHQPDPAGPGSKERNADGATTKAYKIGPIPRCVVIDRKGIVRARCHPNDLTRRTIQTLLDR